MSVQGCDPSQPPVQLSSDASGREDASGISVFVPELPQAPATETRTEAAKATTGRECRIHGTIAGNSMAFKRGLVPVPGVVLDPTLRQSKSR